MSVVAVTFNGNLTGNASSATTASISDESTDTTFYPVFVSNNTGNLSLKVDKTTNPLSYNPSTGTLISQIVNPGGGTTTNSSLTASGLEVFNATTGKTIINNNQITCATNQTGTPPITTITPTNIKCSNFGATSNTTITSNSIQLLTSPTQYVTLRSVDAVGNQILLNGSAGTSGQVLTSGGSGGTLSWSTPSGGSSFVSGFITPVTNGIVIDVSFPAVITTSNPPLIILTGDNNNTTIIVSLTVAGIIGSTGNWSGFRYLTSGTGLNKIYWIAIPN